MQNTRIIDPPGLILTSGAYMSSRSWVQLSSIFENQAINMTKQLLCLFKNLAAFWLATLGKVLLSSLLQKKLNTLCYILG